MHRAHKLIATAAMGILVGAAASLYSAALPGALPAYAETGAPQPASVISASLTWLRWPAIRRSATLQ